MIWMGRAPVYKVFICYVEKFGNYLEFVTLIKLPKTVSIEKGPFFPKKLDLSLISLFACL